MHPPTVDYSRKWFVMTAVAIGTLLATIDGSIVNVALPTLVGELNTNFATVQWVILAYLLTTTTLLLTVGRLGDMRGKKPLFTGGIIIFTLGSLLCGLSPTVAWLIGARIVQGVGAAMMFALGMAIVTEAFPPDERGKAIGLNGTFVSVGIILGPTLGGIILNDFAWNWIFFVNIPIGIVGTILALRYIPQTRPGDKQRFDFPGAITMFISLLALLLALTWGQQRGFTDPLILALFLMATIFLAIFLAIEWQAPQPMVDLQLFRNRIFSINLSMGLIVFVAIAGATLLLPFYLNDMRGFTPRQTGLLMALLPIFLGITAPLAGWLSDKWGTRPISMIGLLIGIFGYLMMSRFDANTNLLGYILGVVPIGLGMGFFQSPNNSAVMGASPQSQLGVASGLLAMSRNLGQITGIALLGALWATLVNATLGFSPPDGATSAPIPAQLSGLSSTFFVMALLLALALLLNAWGLLQERHQQRKEDHVVM